MNDWVTFIGIILVLIGIYASSPGLVLIAAITGVLAHGNR